MSSDEDRNYPYRNRSLVFRASYKITLVVLDIYDKMTRSSDADDTEKKTQNGAKEESKETTFQLDPNNVDLESLTCPITCETINEPASTVYGHLYELSAIKKWVAQKGTCPLTHKPLTLEQI